MTTMVEGLRRIASLDGEPYVVGGALRDALLGVEASEVDIAVRGAERWAASAGDRLGVRAARIGSGPSTWRLVVAGGWIDVAELEGDLPADLARRDFTVNAMAAPLRDFLSGDLNEALIDPLGGRVDLAAGRLRLASPNALAADPLRILRGVRLEATRRLRMTVDTEAAARRQAANLAAVPAERVWAELERIFSHDSASPSVRRIEQLDALDAIFPELGLGRGVDQRPVHRRDVFDHQLDALEWLDALISPERPAHPTEQTAGQLWTQLWKSEAFADTSALRVRLREGRLILRLATLLHDIGKPGTRRVEADGRTRFFGHSELGAELVRARLTALRAPTAIIAPVQTLVLHHLRPGQVSAPGRAPTDRALYRFHKALSHRAPGDLAVPLCWLFLADSLATVGGDALAPRWPAYVAHVSQILGWREQARRRTESEFGRGIGRILDGHAIMDATGLMPGKQVGEIRAAIDEAAAVGEIRTIADARALAVRLATSAPGAATDGERSGERD